MQYIKNIKKLLVPLKWLVLFILMITLILFIALQVHPHNKNLLNTLVESLQTHAFFWLFIRSFIVLSFFICWPVLVNHWSKKYAWPEPYAAAVKKRRWRYVAWFIVIDLTFQLL